MYTDYSYHEFEPVRIEVADVLLADAAQLPQTFSGNEANYKLIIEGIINTLVKQEPAFEIHKVQLKTSIQYLPAISTPVYDEFKQAFTNYYQRLLGGELCLYIGMNTSPGETPVGGSCGVGVRVAVVNNNLELRTYRVTEATPGKEASGLSITAIRSNDETFVLNRNIDVVKFNHEADDITPDVAYMYKPDDDEAIGFLLNVNFPADGKFEKGNFMAGLTTLITPARHVKLDHSITKASEKDQANACLAQWKATAQQGAFAHISPNEFVRDADAFINRVHTISQGKSTNFCWAASIFYYLFEKEPLGAIEATIGLYQTGVFRYHGGNDVEEVVMEAPEEVRDIVGTQHWNERDENNWRRTTNKVAQMLYLTLAASTETRHDPLDYRYFRTGYYPGRESNHWAGRTIHSLEDTLKSFGIWLNREGTAKRYRCPDDEQCQIFDLKKAFGFSPQAKVIVYLNSHRWADVLGATGGVNILNQPEDNDPEDITSDGGISFIGIHYVLFREIAEEQPGQFRVTYWDYGCWKQTKGLISSEDLCDVIFGIIWMRQDD